MVGLSIPLFPLLSIGNLFHPLWAQILIQRPLATGDGEYTELTEWGSEAEKLTAEIEEKEMRWLELAEMVEG